MSDAGEVLRRRVQVSTSASTSPNSEPHSPITRSPVSSSPHHRRSHFPGGGATTWFTYSRERQWPSWRVDVNIAWVILVVAGFLSRFWRIDYPRYVIFDEVHFGKFASYYLTRTFFFDVHPPLGKMIFAAIGYLNGFNGNFLFTNIGIEFPADVPYIFMRSMSALAGSLLIPCVYQIMIELGFSQRAALLAGIFTILDNSLVIQSRVIMLDSFVIFFTYLSILGFLRFYHTRHIPFSSSWHKWLVFTGVSLGCLLGVKYTGLLGLGCVGLLTMCDLWQLIGDPALDLVDLLLHTLLRGLYLLGIPTIMSFVLFYIHFAILTQSGPGNAFVSTAFKNSLEGTTQPSKVEFSPNATLLRYGSKFSLHSSDTSCWLHSHDHLYPLKYPDGRGSSYQQQVTCYEFKDPNNLWYIRKPGDPTNGDIGNDTSLVLNKDTVELVHVSSRKLLNSHDVAAPLTPTHQEVACYINYSSQFVPNLQWKVDVIGLAEEDPIYYEPGKLKLKLMHINSKQALATTGKRLPDWAFEQYEVATERALESSQTTWTLDELVTPEGNELEGEDELRKAALLRRRQAGEVKNNSTINFWEKYFEMQYHMVTAHGNLGDHQFGAKPQNWPLMGKTLPYWLDETSNAQVTLIGNPLLWWVSTAVIAFFLALSTFYLLRRKRLVFDLTDYQLWMANGTVLLVGWLAHYVPYFLLSRVLFLHHYLPALPFKFMLLAAVCEHAHTWIRGYPRFIHLLYYAALAALCLLFLLSFLIFAPFTYGYPGLSRAQIDWRHWVETWDLLHR